MENTNIIFGSHAVIEALLSGKKLEKVLLRRGMEGPGTDKLLGLCQDQQVPVQFVPVEKLDRSTPGRHQGVVAYMAALDYVPIEAAVDAALEKTKNPIVVLLDGVTDVRNFGAIARTAECAGASLLVVPAKGGAAPNAEAVKTSAGALLRMPVSRVPNLRTAIYYLKESGFNIVGATEKSQDWIYKGDLIGPVALILGSEETGISSAALALCDQQLSIPLQGEIASLNVSAAAAVALFEIIRQRSALQKGKQKK